MLEYKLISGNKQTVETEVVAMLNSGWIALDLTSTTIGSTPHFTQAMYRDVSTSLIVEPSTAKTKLKKHEKPQKWQI